MGKADVTKQEMFVKMHEELQHEGLTLPNIRLAIIKDKQLGIKDLHSYRARLHTLGKLPEYAARLAPFKMQANNRKDKMELVPVHA